MAAASRSRLIVPAAGFGARFASAGFQEPKPFVPVRGVPMVELAVRGLRSCLGDLPATLVMREEMRSMVGRLRLDDVSYVFLDQATDGAATTVERGLMSAVESGSVGLDDAVVVANSDQLVTFDGSRFWGSLANAAGSILTFTCRGRDPKWSYVDAGLDGRVKRVAEKVPISDEATVGVYGFRTARSLLEAVSRMRSADDRVNGELYLCPAFNHLDSSLSGLPLTVPCDRMWGLGTPEDLFASLNDVVFSRMVDELARR